MNVRGWFGRAAVVMALVGADAGPAAAWDPSTTHMSMAERSVLNSAMHVRWMDASQLQLGLFTPIRLDPARLPDRLRHRLEEAIDQVHAASGAQPLGGPGACPGPSAPEQTRARCVQGDLWEMTALGWLQLGVILETSPTERLLHHFVDRHDPTAMRWTDDDLPRVVLRSKYGKSGGSLASRINGTGFEGTGPSVMAWLRDPRDPWAPLALSHHLRQASQAPTPLERSHHRALALLCTGALLHVVQDLSVPAHARGDISAMFLPLSELPGDRGLPIQELARKTYGRATLPQPLVLSPRPAPTVARGILMAPTIAGHLLGHGDWPGLIRLSGGHFFSESSLPPSQRLSPSLSPTEAAEQLLAGAELHPQERSGARLSAWPAERGYLLGGSGRPLAAFRHDDQDRVILWLDRFIYRTQMRQLIPVGVDVGRSILDLIYAPWPDTELDVSARTLTVTPDTMWSKATLQVLIEDAKGRRTPRSAVTMQAPSAHRVVDAWPADLAPDTRVVLVLQNPPGMLPAVVERGLDLDSVVVEPEPEPKEDLAAKIPRPQPRAATTVRSREGAAPVRALEDPGSEAPPPDPLPPSSPTSPTSPPDAPANERDDDR